MPPSPRMPVACASSTIRQASCLRGERGNLAERRHVAIHGEHALGQDEFRPVISLILTQKLAEMGGIAMTVTELPHACRLAAEMHAGVIEAIGED